MRIGEIRFADLQPQIGDARAFDVHAIDAQGSVVHLSLRTTEKWGGNGWQQALECPVCASPARVLTVVESVAACRQCQRLSTRRDCRKNTLDWKQNGALADNLFRSLLKPGRQVTPALRAMARQLHRRSLTAADSVLVTASRAIATVDKQWPDHTEEWTFQE